LEEWDEVIARAPEARCFALDLPGFGGSDRSLTDYSLEGQRQALVAFMDALGIEQAVLAGRSMGASLAVWTAAHSKARVSGILLIAPSGFPGSLKYRWPASWVYRPGLGNRIASALVNNRLFGFLFPSSLARQGVGVTASYDTEFARSLDDVTQPAVLVWSPGDKRVPYAFEREYRARLKNSRSRRLPESVGHGVTGNDPTGTADGLAELLGMVPPSR
jgi:pimeloyl-ACP methyl ester carboxylesterase